MIRINANRDQRIEMETQYWKWFSRYHLEDTINIIKRDPKLKSVFNDIMKDSHKTSLTENEQVKVYLLAKPNELIKYQEKMKGKNFYKRTRKHFLRLYENFRTSQAGSVISTLNLTACPYCNQNHIIVEYDEKGKAHFRGELDHYIPKEAYAPLAISLYNLIPSCGVCNRLKSKSNSRIINPYEGEYKTNIKFHTNIKTGIDIKDILNGSVSDNADIKIWIDKQGLSETDLNELKVFRLNTRYSRLQKNVKDIAVVAKAYSNGYIRQLSDNFSKSEGFSLSENDIRRSIFGYSKNHSDRVLSKFN